MVVILIPLPAVAAPMLRSISSPPAARVVPPPVMDRTVPVVNPAAVMVWTIPEVAESAVTLKNPPPV